MLPISLYLCAHALWSIYVIAVQTAASYTFFRMMDIPSFSSVVYPPTDIMMTYFLVLLSGFTFIIYPIYAAINDHFGHHRRLSVRFKPDIKEYQMIVIYKEFDEAYNLLELYRDLYLELKAKHPLLFSDGSKLQVLYRKCNAYHLLCDIIRLAEELESLDNDNNNNAQMEVVPDQVADVNPLPGQAPKKKYSREVKELTLHGTYWTAKPKRGSRRCSKEEAPIIVDEPRPRPTRQRKPKLSNPTTLRRSARIAARRTAV